VAPTGTVEQVYAIPRRYHRGDDHPEAQDEADAPTIPVRGELARAVDWTERAPSTCPGCRSPVPSDTPKCPWCGRNVNQGGSDTDVWRASSALVARALGLGEIPRPWWRSPSSGCRSRTGSFDHTARGSAQPSERIARAPVIWSVGGRTNHPGDRGRKHDSGVKTPRTSDVHPGPKLSCRFVLRGLSARPRTPPSHPSIEEA
jgi:hypothetical protein